MEAQEQVRKAYLQRIANIDVSQIVYVDESGVDQACYKHKGWGKKGQLLIGKKSGKYTKRTNIVAGLCIVNLVELCA